jgi:regulator of RNase E activity RraB
MPFPLSLSLSLSHITSLSNFLSIYPSHSPPFTTTFMPGPKMGARPADFDEDIVRQSPTFIKWQSMVLGEKLRYACRDFVRGHGDDDERLMRRIMIARRNNLRDHDTLKRARSTAVEAKKGKQRKVGTGISEHQVELEMDIAAVESTRSYKAWQSLEEGNEFVYNQKYIKGKDGHDWLLRKNIWRRMRYRRENKKMVEKLKDDGSDPAAAAGIVDQALLVPTTVEEAQDFVNKAVVDAAVAAAESYAKANTEEQDAQDLGAIVHNPLSNEALDAAAKLAAAGTPIDDPDDEMVEYENETQL